jgi:hypothetical protein
MGVDQHYLLKKKKNPLFLSLSFPFEIQQIHDPKKKTASE